MLLRRVFALLLFSWGALAFQENQPIDFFSTRHGLVHNHITALYHQPNGYLWIGTAGGLSRFDGQQFDNFSEFDLAPTGKVIAIEQTGDHRIWFAGGRILTYWADGAFHEAKAFDSNIRKLLATSTGHLWVALDSGLAQWDGQTWFHFGEKLQFPEFPITQIFEGRDGDLWVGMRNGGLIKLNPKKRSWKHFTREDGLPHMTINHFLYSHDGTFWIATHGGVVSYRNDAFELAPFNDQLPSPIIYRLFEDDAKALWMTASNAGAARWDGRNLVTFTEKSGLVSNYSSDFLQDHWGHVWVLCRKGVSIYFGGTLVPLEAEDGIQGRLMTTFLKGDDGLIWIGTTGGLNRYEEPRLKTYLFDPTDRLVQSSELRSIYRDQSDRLWFPTFQGLAVREKNTFKKFTQEDGLPSPVALAWIEKTDGEIWVGTERGVAYFDGHQFQTIADERFTDQVVVKMITDSHDRIWVILGDWNLYRETPDQGRGTFAHVGRFEGVLELESQNDGSVWLSQLRTITHIKELGEQVTVSFESLTGGTTVISRYFDPAGIWWLGTRNGLVRYNGSETTKFDLFDESNPFGVASFYKGRDDRLWFNTIEPQSDWPINPSIAGLAVYDGQNFTHYTRKQGLHPRIPHQVFLDNRGQEWLFSSKGISWVADDKIKHIGVDQGLAGNRPYHLFWDRKDHLWIGSNGGLNKRSGDLLTTLSPNDGLLDSYVFDATEDEDGAIWIRTRSGVQRYRENPNPPEIDLVGVYDGEQALPLKPGLKLKHDQNNLIFQLRGIHLGKGADQMQFDYKLKGKHKEWRSITRESKLHFPGLSADTYSFTVRAYNRDLESSNQPGEFTFTIHPPWWLSQWFLLSAVLLGILLSYLIYRFQLRVRLEKARVFSELHTAHEMQLSLMPKKAPTTSRLEVYGTCEPAKEVGGDYYDYFWLDEERMELGIAIMDVAGKSMEAAIISVMASGLVCSEIGQRNAPAAILSRINFPMYQKTGKKIFTTGLVGALHTDTLRFRWSNAGHMDPILIRDRQNQPLDVSPKRDLPLGAVRTWQYREYEIQLQPGDLLFVYTDGLNEASDKDGDFFGTHRLTRYLEGNAHLSSKKLVANILAEVKTFAGQMPQYDDITMVAIKINADQPDVSLT